MTSLRDRLRALPSFDVDLPQFPVESAPARPLPLLVEWLDAAISAGVLVPHAVTLSTVSVAGTASARTLIVKDVNDDGVVFATRTDGRKVAELERVPHAALTFYWRELGRQVRVRGLVRREPEAVARADEQARPAHSRAAGRLGTQSSPLPSRPEYIRLFRDELERIEGGEADVSGIWAVFTVVADEVEFWASTPDEGQIRLAYTRSGDEWTRSLLWP
ncbi:pyridoxine/pyridoxamine 5'-phosphate oxidase [Microbacterium nymphoidis]|uniref:pyridoxine/pyridoxamine 5'-phosphate oxidase n=1 Tax=Microbacterium nymphoidis TaxID=2898586 RepID=UPI001E4B0FC8|nr:pyridoxal 5'-phosphate synthase [Microbacterium nymphoidis]MCD2500155.1 pyridoxal 5'-phosphate synthase [Microbacterium nymphoidis]